MDWQQGLVYLIVAGAALYLLRGYFRRGKKAGCGGCNSCPGATPPGEETSSPPSLVQLEVPPRRSPRSRPDEQK
jgi:attachment p12 family protein